MARRPPQHLETYRPRRKPVARARVGSGGRRGSVGPRSYTPGSSYGRRRSGAGAGVFVAALAALVIAGVAGWWVWTRPVDATFASTPGDAVISSADATATGTLLVQDMKPGEYAVSVARKGFRALETRVTVKRFGTNRFEFELQPAPQGLKVTAVPDTAICRVLDEAGKQVAEGTGSIETTLPTAAYALEIAAAGKNPYRRELYLDAAANLTVRLDPEGQLVHSLGIVPCAGAPKGVLLTPDGKQAWTTILNGPPSIEIFDLTTFARTGEIDLGKYGAVELVFSRDGKYAYASQMETAKVFEIDTATRKVTREFDTESAWTKVVSLSPDGKTLWAANWSGDDISEIDLASGTLRRRIPVADTPRGLWPTPDGKTLYVAGYGGGELQSVDLATGDVKTLFDSNGALRHLVGDAKRGLLFASDMAKDCVWVYDLATGKTRKFCDTDEKPNTIDLSHDGKVLFVSCRGENNPKSYYIPGFEWGTTLLFDAGSAKPLDAIVGGNQCTALDVSDDGKTLAFSDFLDNRLQIFEVPPYEVLAKGNGGRWAAHFSDLKK